jgi:dephospho-CoA kinase
MKVIGLTGGIGSGKTTVARVFMSEGIPVFDADAEAIALYATDEALLTEVVALFGNDILLDDGTLNRRALAARVFQDAESLQKLNALVHPHVATKFAQWKNLQRSSYVLREAAILFESGSNTDCDAVIVVSAPENVRIRRVMDRNGISEDEVRARMMRQWSEKELIKRADAIIVNDDTKLILPQIAQVKKKLGL